MPAKLDSALLIRRLPKVELHLHLEGSIAPETLREMARRKGRLVEETEQWIADREREGFRYPKFTDFLNAFKLLSLLLETPEDYALATTRLIQSLPAEKVRYVELTLAAGVVLWKKQSLDEVFEAVKRAADEASAHTGVRVSWIFDAIRQFGLDHVRSVMRHAARLRNRGVAGFGIGGDEERGPARLFVDVYREARDLGLHLTAHAGEAAGPESVRDAVELLGAERIGHGTSAGSDPVTLRLLAERRIPVEVCLTSNLATGVIQRIEDHPLRRFLAAGVAVTLSSDDPAMFATSIEREMLLAMEHFALTRTEIVDLNRNAIRAAFLPESERARLLAELNAACDEIACGAGILPA
jgi:aminodeoxyfutalosine deaminase